MMHSIVTCPVAALAAEAEARIADLDAADEAFDSARLDAEHDAIGALADRAVDLAPASAEGAAFLAAVLSDMAEDLARGGMAEHERARLTRRLAAGLGGLMAFHRGAVGDGVARHFLPAPEAEAV